MTSMEPTINQTPTELVTNPPITTTTSEPKTTTEPQNLDLPNNDKGASITEGQATIYSYSQGEVFYNPVQEFNRDMSIGAIRTFIGLRATEWETKQAKKVQPDGDSDAVKPVISPPTVLEALSASGLRSIRYAKEIPGIGHITTNDLDPHVVEEIRRNFSNNGINDSMATPNCGDACDVMYSHRSPGKQYTVVDLDPYGSASPFIDAAVQSVADGGLMCITCTDLAVLASTQHTETCYAKYGGVPLKAGFCHEAGLRMVIQMVMASAARYKRSIKPLLSCSIDFYVRIFVRVYNSPGKVKYNASSTSVVYKCSGCGTFDLSPIGRLTETPKGPKFGPTQGPPVGPSCRFCQNKIHMGGPMYNGKLHDQTFVSAMLELIRKEPTKFNTFKRMEGMLTLISEELDTPLYYLPPDLSSIVRASVPNYIELRSAFLNLGYQISASHCVAGSFKTDAPSEAIWDVFRHWAKKGLVNLGKFPAASPGLAILNTEPKLDVSFDLHPKAKLPSREIKLVRYQVNPTKNWGPKARHKRPTEESAEKKEAKMLKE